jgi:hypothetical protein
MSATPSDFSASPPPPAPPKTNGLATASLVLGILGFICLPVVGGIAGLILGILGLQQIGRSQGWQTGRGLAISGIIVSAVSIVVCVWVTILVVSATWLMFTGGTIKSHVTDSMNNVRQMTVATQAYAASHRQQLPPVQAWDKAFLSANLVTDAALFTDPNDPPGTRSYAMNAALDGLEMSGVPGNTVLFFECAPGSPPAGGRELLPVRPHHAGKYVIGLVNGVVEQVPMGDAGSLLWSPPPRAAPQHDAPTSSHAVEAPLPATPPLTSGG